MFEKPQIRQMKQLKIFRKIPFGRIIPHFSLESSESYSVCNCLHESNSIFRAAGINSEKSFAEQSNLGDYTSTSATLTYSSSGTNSATTQSHNFSIISSRKRVAPGGAFETRTENSHLSGKITVFFSCLVNGFQAQETGAPRCGGAREIPMSCCMCEHVETAQSLGG